MIKSRFRTPTNIVTNVIVLFLLAMFMIPLIQTIFTSIRPDSEIYRTPVQLWPDNPTLDHYRHVFTQLQKDFFSFFTNSVVVTTVSVALILALSSLAAYGLARIDFRGKAFVMFFISFIVAIPLVITVIPVFMMETTLRIKNTNLGLILPYVAVYMPMPLFIIYALFMKVPTDLEDAAMIDGCSRLYVYARIFVPLGKAGIVAAGIISFLSCWGEFLFALILTNKRTSTTLPIGIMMVNQEEQAWAFGPMSAVMILSIIIPMILYLVLQKYFVQGLLEGSIKS
jgi:ABC-type glycerol-3-phosphate transport system permease component